MKVSAALLSCGPGIWIESVDSAFVVGQEVVRFP